MPTEDADKPFFSRFCATLAAAARTICSTLLLSKNDPTRSAVDCDDADDEVDATDDDDDDPKEDEEGAVIMANRAKTADAMQ